MYGFEPNPRWTSVLRDVESSVRPRVASIVVHTETALALGNANTIDLSVDDSPGSKGASIALRYDEGKERQTVRVASLNFVRFVASLPFLGGELTCLGERAVQTRMLPLFFKKKYLIKVRSWAPAKVILGLNEG